jgi:hypothetical protein
MDSTELIPFEKTELFKSIELINKEEKNGVDFYKILENFYMLFDILRGEEDETHQRLALDYYNNFRVKISYPNEIEITGKFIIGKDDMGGYKLDSYKLDEFFINDFLEQDREQVEANAVVAMMSLKTCKPLYFFDDFSQENQKLANGNILKSAKYWRIPPQPRLSCKEFKPLVQKGEKFKIEVGGKRKKKRIMRTKRKRNKHTRRTKRR